MDRLDDINEKDLFSLFRAAQLVARYKEGLLSRAESDDLQQWLDVSPRHREWFDELLDQEERFSRKLDVFKDLNADTERALKEVMAKAGMAPVMAQSKTVRYTPWVAGIAASVLLLLGGFALYRYWPAHQVAPQVAAVVNDILPGQDKATLTLDGKTIVLDRSHEGLIAQPVAGNSIKNNGGLLSYKAESTTSELHYNTVTTGRGGQYKLVLSDGTKVWLDAASSLHFPTAFAGSSREVDLTGQAYFEVAHHKEPFIVHTAKADIQDLGTAFNVNTYTEEGAAQYTLVQGSIRVAPTVGGSHVLVPGQRALVLDGGGIEIQNHVDLDEITAWTKDLFVFDHTDLKTGMREIARWYDIDIVYEGDLGDKKLEGTAPRNENLSVLVRLLNLSGIPCKLVDKKLIVERP
ncbi:FecR family protein [Dinghuibacter silviterrae]|uniref:FecR family protein n=1 Tax=Dinghuibacter silviterrae TaxID=1539049 RepID=A0A4V3GM32_9BACT|nr:FecR domain-containing protein [Dinghuibacter silviterrae]TDX01823.1 FecR family protein [Dinghuibacter silviterrae]